MREREKLHDNHDCNKCVVRAHFQNEKKKPI